MQRALGGWHARRGRKQAASGLLDARPSSAPTPAGSRAAGGGKGVGGGIRRRLVSSGRGQPSAKGSCGVAGSADAAAGVLALAGRRRVDVWRELGTTSAHCAAIPFSSAPPGRGAQTPCSPCRALLRTVHGPLFPACMWHTCVTPRGSPSTSYPAQDPSPLLPSPCPQAGVITVCCGGGGIPVAVDGAGEKCVDKGGQQLGRGEGAACEKSQRACQCQLSCACVLLVLLKGPALSLRTPRQKRPRLCVCAGMGWRQWWTRTRPRRCWAPACTPTGCSC